MNNSDYFLPGYGTRPGARGLASAAHTGLLVMPVRSNLSHGALAIQLLL